MNNLPNCPKCNSEYVYEDGALLVCPECAYEWNPAEVVEEEGVVAIDANGNKLADGDDCHLDQRLESEGRTKRFETRNAREKHPYRRRRPQYRL